MSQARPKVLAVIDAFVDEMREVSGIVGAAYDVPFNYGEEDTPFTYVYDVDGEEFDVDSASFHLRNDLYLRTMTLFRCSDDAGDPDQSLYRKGNFIAANLLERILRQWPQTLGGLAKFVLPKARVVGGVAEDPNLGVLTMLWNIRFTMQVTNIRAAA